MATSLEGKLLGERRDNYASSSDSEHEEPRRTISPPNLDGLPQVKIREGGCKGGYSRWHLNTSTWMRTCVRVCACVLIYVYTHVRQGAHKLFAA